MRARLPKTITSLFLAALVLTTGIVPPAVCHAHEGGEDADHHHTPVARDGHHPHRGLVPHDHHHHGRSAREGSRPAGGTFSSADRCDYAVHRHWYFLGVAFSAPVPDDDRSDEEASRIESAVVQLHAPPPPGLDRDAGAGRVLAGSALVSLDLGLVQASPPIRVDLTRGIPLCDRARRERSGVLRV